MSDQQTAERPSLLTFLGVTDDELLAECEDRGLQVWRETTYYMRAIGVGESKWTSFYHTCLYATETPEEAMARVRKKWPAVSIMAWKTQDDYAAGNPAIASWTKPPENSEKEPIGPGASH